MNPEIKETNYKFSKQTGFYRGKVRDVYYINNTHLVIITSDRISAFDHVLPRVIPYKGQVLNKISVRFLSHFAKEVPNWFISSPHPNVMIGHLCQPFKVEMVIRGYLAGHAWRTYQEGKRTLCGVTLPEGLKENDLLPTPIITPTTKASEGHDEDISKEEIIKQGIVSAEDYEILEKYTHQLFQLGTEYAKKQDLILVDTKYEFGKSVNGEILLMDEIHTPDSSRYFYLDGYQKRQASGEKQKQLSKEFVREWLIENGFQGKDGQKIPAMTDDIVSSISNRYVELFEVVMGGTFQKIESSNVTQDIFDAVEKELASLTSVLISE